jgi:pimeloyl-ACP methyl ester carboxylesterase
VHPFAEEMNKSRRMAALQSRALAAQGYAVLQIDLFGCGDSGGDFATRRGRNGATTSRRDAMAAARVSGAITLWGLRLGATAGDATRRATAHARVVRAVAAGARAARRC